MISDSPFGGRHARLLGVGSYRPRRIVGNDEICTYIDSSDEWIQERSGIKTRRWAGEGESIVDMGCAAALSALEMAGLEPSDIDMVILASCTVPQTIWPTAGQIQGRLGTKSPAFEINSTCGGFCYALGIARDLVRGGTVDNVLVIASERLTDVMDPHDRSTMFILADGAGAVVMGPSDFPGVGPVSWGADGEKGEALCLTPTWIEYRNDPTLPTPSLRMQGQRIFRWAVEVLPGVLMDALDKAGVKPDDLDVFIPHQANERIIDSVLKVAGLPSDLPVARDIVETGNTSAASVPLAMHRMLTEGTAHSGDLALLLGFGGGLSYASQVVVLP